EDERGVCLRFRRLRCPASISSPARMTLKPQAKAAAEGEHCRPQNLPGELGESGFQVFEGVEGRRTGSLSAVRDLASHDRGFHFHIANSFRFDVKDVVTQDD